VAKHFAHRVKSNFVLLAGQGIGKSLIENKVSNIRIYTTQRNLPNLKYPSQKSKKWSESIMPYIKTAFVIMAR
jgi:hypothetical protein